MNLPSYDHVTRRSTSAVERANYKNSQVTNAELKKLNSTTKAIADANEKLVKIQTQALDESNKQTAILDAQLEIAKINELEKTRQNQIKQAAFSVEQRINEISNESSKVSQYFYYKDELNQVELVGLTPDSPNEIADKQYVRDILSKLQILVNAVKLEISNKEMLDVDSYYVNVNELAELRYSMQNLVDEFNNAKLPKVAGFLGQIFWPRFVANPGLNFIFIIIYYIAVYQSYGISFLFGVVFYYLNKGRQQKLYEKELHQYEEMKISIKNSQIEIDRLELFFQNFKRDYSLPV